MPTPSEGESEKDFVSRCMSYPDMQRYEPKQRAAICYSKFRGEAVHPDFQRIISLFFKRYRVGEAIEKFGRFVMRNSLNLSKAYKPEVQFKESFEWIEPLIQPYKQDKDAKYYLVTALTADISMNNVDYGGEDRLAREDSSMNWRPVNINHDHDKWLSYPRTRVDFSAANEFSLEATLRVDNRDAWLQKMLDEGKILHPSIEGRPHPIGGRYHFTGLALLEKGVELPGSPLTEIVPLVFSESVGKSICEFKGGKMVCECDTKQSEVKNNLKETVKEAITEVLTESGLKEQEVPDATNAPSTVGKDDTVTCPENHHWDPDANKCVPDVKQECEAGWHFDVALEKCIPDNPQVNEQKLRLAKATADLENIELKEQIVDRDAKIQTLHEQASKVKAELKVERESHIATKCTLEGRISELEERRKSETERADKAHKQEMEEAQRNIGLLKDNDVLRKDLSESNGLVGKQKLQIDNLTRQNTDTFSENAKLSADLTDAKNREIQWNKDKAILSEGLAKALKHQKYVYEFLKTKGFEIVST